MLAETINANLYADWLAQVQTSSAKDAFVLLVGTAATLKELTCHVQHKGVIRDFRFIDKNDEQPFSFIINRKWLLFYFRGPATRSGRYTFEELRRVLPMAKINARKEWTVRLANVEETRALLGLLKLR